MSLTSKHQTSCKIIVKYKHSSLFSLYVSDEVRGFDLLEVLRVLEGGVEGEQNVEWLNPGLVDRNVELKKIANDLAYRIARTG